MTKRLRTISVLLTAWLFAFSLLSNCYCAPIAVEPSAQAIGVKSEMPAHCEHHLDTEKQKKSDCSPRVNSDQFELSPPQAQVILKVQVVAIVIPDILFGSDYSSEDILKISRPQESPPPQFFLHHHSFLI